LRRNLAPSALGDLLELPLVAVLATRRADGGVLLSPVWHRWRDGGFDVVTSSDDVKVRHLRRDPRASIVVYEHVRPYRGIELRYGLDGEQPRTLDEVGRAFNVTRERIRQIENQSLKKLRALALTDSLKDVA